jgi:endonuclease YncB( thermonuclease family)
MRLFSVWGILLILLLIVLLAACSSVSTSNSGTGETGRVVRVIDGDTIDVNVNGQVIRVRYVGVNTPERDEVCYQDATDANRRLVENKTVRLERDTSDTDRYDRPLRYVYVGDTFVNWELVKDGYAEAVLYEPDDRYYQDFLRLESQATLANLGCHPTGIFDDGSTRR